VLGLSRSGAIAPDAGRGVAVDLLDARAVDDAVAGFEPEIVYHLAALSSVGRSWEAPGETLAGNVGAAANVLEAVRSRAPDARVLWVSTCEVYGSPEQLPTDEHAPLAPANPYAVSMAAAEMLAAVYARSHGLAITCARPFSHSGPGQRPIFLMSNLARQGAEGRRAGITAMQVVTGNPVTRRDFTDVRDVARAYRLLAGLDATPGVMDVYNVSSGRSISAAEQVHTLGRLLAPIEVQHIVDPARVRASEVMELRGDHSRLTAATGWEPEITFEQTMAEAIAWWERELADGGPLA
jgi:GDP-4-dehydro-6-deoxy-D-mannose reductase